ncbi:tubulin delta chain-like [Stylophora pistillata]|uniref:tubulin delta chain-like n=1 Tax=Stylophora pistillata TaxID=50429 RepID=UPI000C03DAA2|nr:tubulin delta chain-like [Stylophora pistillata]
MSSIVLLVGQCGNQVGHELMRLIDKSDVHPLSHRDGKLRCVCVDSESKVIGHNYREDTRSSKLYREGNMISGQRGRGNNWALGYHGLSGETEDTSLLHRAMEIVRKEVERCDNYAGTIVFHSLTGGTGSGLGSRLIETLRDAYPLAHVMSVAVSPHSSGDSPLQHYNSLLSLSSLQYHADAVLLFSNDDILHHIATHTGLSTRQNPSGSISLKDMNYYISLSLAGVLQPLGSKPKLIKGNGNEPWEMFRSLCSEPSKKFATLHHMAKSKVSWESLTQSLIRSIRRYDRNGMQFSTLGSLLVARGDHDGSFAEIWPKIEDKLRTSLRFVDWNPFPIDFWISQYNPVGPKDSQSLTLCLNSTKILETLEDVMRKARAMYDAGAYLHWFSKHGCSKNDFLDAFETLESVVEEYNLGVK